MIEYHLPTEAQASDLILARLGSFLPKPFAKKAITAKAHGLSYAEICRACNDAIKDAIMHDRGKVQETVLGAALEERRLINKKLAENKLMSPYAEQHKR